MARVGVTDTVAGRRKAVAINGTPVENFDATSAGDIFSVLSATIPPNRLRIRLYLTSRR